MRARSWMAALALMSYLDSDRAGIVRPSPGPGQEPSPSKEAKKPQEKPAAGPSKDPPKSGLPPEKRKGSGSYFPTIQLGLASPGIGTEG